MAQISIKAASVPFRASSHCVFFWEHWEEEGARDQEHVALLIGGGGGDPRVRPGSVILPISLRISESQFPQL